MQTTQKRPAHTAPFDLWLPEVAPATQAIRDYSVRSMRPVELRANAMDAPPENTLSNQWKEAYITAGLFLIACLLAVLFGMGITMPECLTLGGF